MLTVKELLYIKLVAQERSFSSAAKRAKISQPALSAAIAKAEDKLGESLFYRDSHTVNATAAGRYIAERSEYLLNQFETLTSEFADFKNRDTGAIPFGIGVSVADTLLKDALFLSSRRTSLLRRSFILTTGTSFEKPCLETISRFLLPQTMSL